MTNLKKLQTLSFVSNEYDDLYYELQNKLETFCATILSSDEEFNEERELIANFLRKYANAIS
jgi:hypothetical protein